MPKEYSRLLTEPRGEIWRVTIHRPGDRNSIDSVLMKELTVLLGEIEKSPARAVVFTGSGEEYFIGGADGVEMMRCRPPEARTFSARIQKLFNRLEASPLVLAAAINGLCFGGGFEFAMACDLRIAGEKARIGLPEVKVGIIPGGGGTQRLPQLVGMGRAMEMILSGKLYGAEEARQIGLVHSVVPQDRLLEEAEKALQPVLRNPPHAISQAKRAVRSFSSGNFARGLRSESEAFSRCFAHSYFADLMRKQLNEGTLKTTVHIQSELRPERKRKQ